jgi:hypothetical protein
MKLNRISSALVFGVVALTGVAHAYQGARNELEANAGWYLPSDVKLDFGNGTRAKLGYQDTLSWGVRYGHRISDSWGLGVSWTHVDMDAAASDANNFQCSTCQFNADFYDFSGEWYPGGGEWALYGGAGWLTTNFKVSIRGDSNDRSFSDDTFTYHIGTAYTWHIGSSFYIRPDLRVRFLQLDRKGRGKYDSEDPEVKVGFGWMF